MRGRSLVDLDSLTHDELYSLLDRAAEYRQKPPGELLRGTGVVNLFFEASTRTYASFTLAEQRLGAHIVSLNPTISSFTKGEALEDAATTLAAMGIRIIVTRHGTSGFPALLASYFDGHVINAGDGAHAHPTQALLDLLTMRDVFGRIDGLRVAIVGDVVHSRVARSNAVGLGMIGAQTIYVGPRTLVPDGLAGVNIAIERDLDAILPEVDVV